MVYALMLARIILALSIVAMAAGCRRDTAPPDASSALTRLYTHEGLGLSFEIPRAWEEKLEGNTLVFSGKTNQKDHFTTVSVQIVPRRDAGLMEALAQACAPVVGYPGFGWQLREPVIISGRPAVRYGFRVAVHESLRQKHGVLIDTGRHFVDIAYAAPAESFDDGIPVFEHVITTLTVAP